MRKFIFILLLPISLFAQTPIYRSVQPGVTAAIGTGTGTLTISGSTATFSVSQPDSIGVGDAIQYDSDGNNSIDAIAFIHGRTNSTIYTVKSASGGNPTEATDDTDYDIFRSYTSLSNWESGTENTGIDAAVVAFDGGNRNIDTANEYWYVACYPGTDTTPLLLSGWTTSTTDKILIYTPFLASEVGRPMRHEGVWSDYYYNLVPSVGSAYAIQTASSALHTEYRGLQIYMQANSSALYAVYTNVALAEVVVANCIIKGNVTESSATRFDGVHQATSGKTITKNNIIYDFKSPSTANDAGISNITGTSVSYNNTVVNCAIGIERESGNIWANGCIVQSCTDGYSGAFGAGTSHNISDLSSDVPGTDGLNNVVLSFRNSANDDFRLYPGDVSKLGVGLNIVTYDANTLHQFTDDVESDLRRVWHRGADEFRISFYQRKKL